MLSSKAKAVADKITSLNEDDVRSISEMIQHEVHHATDVLTERAKSAEARLRQFADHAGDDVSRYSKRAAQTITENPIPSTAVALGIGVVLGLVLAGTSRR